MLLGISVLSIFIAKTGLIPTEISALGVKMEKTDQNAFLVVMALIVSYFVAAFLIYGLMDFLAWRVSYNKSTRLRYEEVHKAVQEQISNPNVETASLERRSWASIYPNYLARPVSFMRVLFEFPLPVAVGSYAIYALVSAIK